MNVKLLTEHHLQFLSLKGGCKGSSESTLLKIPHCWKSHVTAQMSFIICTCVCMQPYFSIGRLPVMRDGDVTETKVANIFTLLRKQVLHIQ